MRLFLKYQGELRGYLRALLRDSADAEDLLQEVGVKVLTHSETPLDPQHFPLWCRAVAKNMALHFWRSRRRSIVEIEDPMSAVIDQAYAESDETPHEWELRQKLLRDCMQKLSERERELLTLRYVAEITSDEIGKKTNRTPTSIRMALMRLREALMRCLQRKISHGARYA